MNANQLSDLLSKLGNKEQSNLFDLILQPITREKAYEDSEKYFYSLEPGLEAVFLEDDETFCSLDFTLHSRLPEVFPYEGELPLSVNSRMNREEVVKLLGNPIESGPPRTIPILGASGGWDKFQIRALPQAYAIVGYMPDLRISSIRLAIERDA